MNVSPSPPILFSDDAAAKVLEMITEEGNPELRLRVYVTGGGCSGFQYGFAFEESTGADDILIDKGGVQILIDPVSMQYLSGAEVDYQDGLEGSKFVIRNPNAQSTCGCGSSFSTTATGDSSNEHQSDRKSCAPRPAIHQ